MLKYYLCIFNSRVMREIKIISEGRVLSRILSGEAISDIIHCLEAFPEIFIVYDRSVSDFALKLADEASFRTAGANSNCSTDGSRKIIAACPISTGEKSKSIDSVMDICKWLLEKNADRKALLLGVGGGITSDIVGFAASIYKRGIRFAYIPTTLLAQVDAAVGGKTGVNFMGYKNMIGVINQPEFTFEIPEVLDTLPYKDFVSGSTEMLKTFIIDNRNGNYEKAVRILSEIHSSNDRTARIRQYKSELLNLITAAAEIKAGIVGRDQFEKGERRKLNLGHTFAHAIEWQASMITNNPKGSGIINISHGEAVAIGIVMAAKLSRRIGVCENNGLAEKIRKDFISCGYAVDSPFDILSLADAMKKDKKAENRIVHFILIESIGKVAEKDLDVDKVLNIMNKDK